MVTINNKTYSQGWQSHGNTSCRWAVHGLWWGQIWGTVFYHHRKIWGTVFTIMGKYEVQCFTIMGDEVIWITILAIWGIQLTIIEVLGASISWTHWLTYQWNQGDLWGTLESAHTPQGLSKVIILDVNMSEIFTFTFSNFSFPTNFSEMSGKHSSPTWSAPAIALTTISGSE